MLHRISKLIGCGLVALVLTSTSGLTVGGGRPDGGKPRFEGSGPPTLPDLEDYDVHGAIRITRPEASSYYEDDELQTWCLSNDNACAYGALSFEAEIACWAQGFQPSLSPRVALRADVTLELHAWAGPHVVVHVFMWIGLELPEWRSLTWDGHDQDSATAVVASPAVTSPYAELGYGHHTLHASVRCYDPETMAAAEDTASLDINWYDEPLD